MVSKRCIFALCQELTSVKSVNCLHKTNELTIKFRIIYSFWGQRYEMYPQGRICFSCGTCLMCLFDLYVILALWISVSRFAFCLCFNRFYFDVRSCFVW